MGEDILANSHKKLAEYAKSFLYAFIVFIILYISLWPVRIVGVSMEPVLSHNDRVFVSRAIGFFGVYGGGDIVMVRARYHEGRRFIIKRIIAEPGDELRIENGSVFVNDEPVGYFDEVFVSGDLSLTLAAGQYFLMGDNSSYSFDSRNFGAVDRNDIIGKVLFRFFSGNIFGNMP